ncbi:hypothetical protein BGW38_008785, partial [Lunasporangiospora selenospora]
VIPQGSERERRPMFSHYEKRRKVKARAETMDWAKEMEFQKMSEGAIAEELKSVDSKIKELERKTTKGRKGLKEHEADQSLAAKNHRTVVRKENGKTDKDGIGGHRVEDEGGCEQKKTYRALQEAREKVRALRAIVQPQESQLRRLRKERSYWIGLCRAVRAKTPKSKDGPKAMAYTTPTAMDFTVEDSTRHLDISKLPEESITFAGTDPGIRTMTVTCAQTLGEIKAHVNRYAVLYGAEVDVEKTLGYSNLEPWPPPLEQGPSAKTVANASRSRVDSGSGEATRKSRPFKITAPQINEATGMRRIAKKRERRLKRPENSGAREALERLSDKEQVLKTAQTMEEIDRAHELHRESRGVLRAFEKCKARLKDLHNQRLRTRRAWGKLAAAEREYVKNHALEMLGSEVPS